MPSNILATKQSQYRTMILWQCGIRGEVIKCSDGCLHCYIHKGDYKRKVNTNEIVKTNDFDKPIVRQKNGNYKLSR